MKSFKTAEEEKKKTTFKKHLAKKKREIKTIFELKKKQKTFLFLQMASV